MYLKNSILLRFIAHKYLPLIIVAASFIFRTTYAITLSDAQSGQDAPSYLVSALRLLQDGPFAGQTAAPYFPIGYPWFVATIWKVFGVSYHALGVVQNLLLALSLFAFYRIVRDYFGNRIALILLSLLSINPAVTASVSLLAYETPMASFLILGFYFLHKSQKMQAFSLAFFLSIFASSGLFTIAITFQPKILLSIIVIVLIYLWQGANRISLFKNIIVASIVFSVIAIGPAAAIYRNWKAGDGVGYTQNFATNIVVGMNNSNAHLDFSKCHGSKYDSVSKSFCMLLAKLEAPSDGIKIATHQGTYFWTPFIGNLKFMGTWYHGADWRRLVPSYTWWDTNSIWYGVDRMTGYLWTFGLVLLIIYGFRLSFQRTTSRIVPFLFAIPVIFLWLVSVITYGEPRYRLPILPFYTLFLAISIEHIITRLMKPDRILEKSVSDDSK